MDKMTEHKRYYITVPKNAAAEYAYDHGEETKEQIERLILSGDDFYRIYRLGLFDDINIACDSLIDDYEEEVLKDVQLQKAAEVLDKYLL